MKKLTKMLCVFFALSSIIYGQTYLAENSVTNSTDTETKIYDIGTGLSLNYFYENIGIIVDSYHFFNAFGNRNDKLFLKLGMGINYSMGNPTNTINEPIETSPVGFIVTGSLGYMVSIYDFNLRGLEEFGAGIAIDYTHIGSTSSIHTAGDIASIQTLGITLQLVLNEYLVGLGTGVVVAVQSGRLPLSSPYAKISFGIIF